MLHYSLDDIKAREPVPGYRGKFVHTGAVSVAHWEISGGKPLPEHSHPHEQTLNLMEGRFSITVAGETRDLEPGSIVVIPGGVPHSGRAVTDCRIIDVFHPIREDYR